MSSLESGLPPAMNEFFYIVVGDKPPQYDGVKARAAKIAAYDIADQVEEVIPLIDDVIKRVLSGMDTMVSPEFAKSLAAYTSQPPYLLPALAAQLRAMGDYAENTGDEATAMRVQALVMLSQLMIDLIQSLVLVVFNPIAALEEMDTSCAITRFLLRILQSKFYRYIVEPTVMNTALQVLQTAVTQLVLIKMGIQQGWNWGEIGVAFEIGLLGGALAPFIRVEEHYLGNTLGTLFAKVLGTVLEPEKATRLGMMLGEITAEMIGAGDHNVVHLMLYGLMTGTGGNWDLGVYMNGMSQAAVAMLGRRAGLYLKGPPKIPLNRILGKFGALNPSALNGIASDTPGPDAPMPDTSVPGGGQPGGGELEGKTSPRAEAPAQSPPPYSPPVSAVVLLLRLLGVPTGPATAYRLALGAGLVPVVGDPRKHPDYAPILITVKNGLPGMIGPDGSFIPGDLNAVVRDHPVSLGNTPAAPGKGGNSVLPGPGGSTVRATGKPSVTSVTTPEQPVSGHSPATPASSQDPPASSQDPPASSQDPPASSQDPPGNPPSAGQEQPAVQPLPAPRSPASRPTGVTGLPAGQAAPRRVPSGPALPPPTPATPRASRGPAGKPPRLRDGQLGRWERGVRPVSWSSAWVDLFGGGAAKAGAGAGTAVSGTALPAGPVPGAARPVLPVPPEAGERAPGPVRPASVSDPTPARPPRDGGIAASAPGPGAGTDRSVPAGEPSRVRGGRVGRWERGVRPVSWSSAWVDLFGGGAAKAGAGAGTAVSGTALPAGPVPGAARPVLPVPPEAGERAPGPVRPASVSDPTPARPPRDGGIAASAPGPGAGTDRSVPAGEPSRVRGGRLNWWQMALGSWRWRPVVMAAEILPPGLVAPARPPADAGNAQEPAATGEAKDPAVAVTRLGQESQTQTAGLELPAGSGRRPAASLPDVTWLRSMRDTVRLARAAAAAPRADGWITLIAHGAGGRAAFLDGDTWVDVAEIARRHGLYLPADSPEGTTPSPPEKPGKVMILGCDAAHAARELHAVTGNVHPILYAGAPHDDGIAQAGEHPIVHAIMLPGRRPVGAVEMTDVIAGSWAGGESGEAIPVPNGDWVLWQDGAQVWLDTPYLAEALHDLRVTVHPPAADPPDHPVGFYYGPTAALLTALNAAGYHLPQDGLARSESDDAFYTSLIDVAGPLLRAVLGQEATLPLVRQRIEQRLLADLESEGYVDPVQARRRLRELLGDRRQAAILLPNAAANEFSLDLRVIGGLGQVLPVGDPDGPRLADEAGRPFLLALLIGHHFAPAIPEEDAQPGAFAGSRPAGGLSPWSEPLGPEAQRLADQEAASAPLPKGFAEPAVLGRVAEADVLAKAAKETGLQNAEYQAELSASIRQSLTRKDATGPRTRQELTESLEALERVVVAEQRRDERRLQVLEREYLKAVEEAGSERQLNADAARRAALVRAIGEMGKALQDAHDGPASGPVPADGIRQALDDAVGRAEAARRGALDASVQASVADLDGKISQLARAARWLELLPGAEPGVLAQALEDGGQPREADMARIRDQIRRLLTPEDTAGAPTQQDRDEARASLEALERVAQAADEWRSRGQQPPADAGKVLQDARDGAERGPVPADGIRRALDDAAGRAEAAGRGAFDASVQASVGGLDGKISQLAQARSWLGFRGVLTKAQIEATNEMAAAELRLAPHTDAVRQTMLWQVKRRAALENFNQGTPHTQATSDTDSSSDAGTSLSSDSSSDTGISLSSDSSSDTGTSLSSDSSSDTGTSLNFKSTLSDQDKPDQAPLEYQGAPDRELPPGFGTVDSEGNLRCPMGHQGRWERLGGVSLDDWVAIAELVAGVLPDADRALTGPLEQQVLEYLEGHGRHAFIEELQGGGLTLEVPGPSKVPEPVTVALNLGDMRLAHYLRALQDEPTDIGLKGHHAVEAEQATITTSRHTVGNNRSLTATPKVVVPLDPSGWYLAVGVGFSGSSGVTYTSGQDTVSAIKRAPRYEGMRARFDFRGASLRVDVGGRANSRPLIARAAFPEELCPVKQPGDPPGAFRPTPRTLPGSAGLDLSLVPPERTASVLSQFKHMPEGAHANWRKLREQVNDELTGKGVRDRKVVKSVARVISEKWVLRMYGNITAPFAVSPVIRDSSGHELGRLLITAKPRTVQASTVDDLGSKEEGQQFTNNWNTKTQSGSMALRPMIQPRHVFGDVAAALGDFSELLPTFGGAFSLSSTRELAVNTGSGDIRGIVYWGDSVRYWSGWDLSIQVVKKDAEHGKIPTVSGNLETNMRVPGIQRDRFEYLLKQAAGLPVSGPVPVDGQLGPEHKERYPPPSVVAGQGIHLSAVDHLSGGEKVLPRLLDLIDEATAGLPLTDKITPYERLSLAAQLSSHFTLEALKANGSALFQPGGMSVTLSRPMTGKNGGMQIITIRVKATHGRTLAAQGRVGRATVEVMVPAFAGIARNDTVSYEAGVEGGLGGFGGLGSENQPRQIGGLFGFGISRNVDRQSGEGVEGQDVRAVLYEGPAYTFDYSDVKFDLHVGVRKEAPPRSRSWLPHKAAAMARRRRGISGALAEMMKSDKSDTTLTGQVRFIIPEELTLENPADPAAVEDVGRPQRLTPPQPRPLAEKWGLDPAVTVQLPSLFDLPEDYKHVPLTRDDQIVEALGSEAIAEAVREVLIEVGLAKATIGNLPSRLAAPDSLRAALINGSPGITQTVVERGIFFERHTTVTIELSALNARVSPELVRIFQMDVAEGGPSMQYSTTTSLAGGAMVQLPNLGIGSTAGAQISVPQTTYGRIYGRATGTARNLTVVSGRLTQATRNYQLHTASLGSRVWATSQRRSFLTTGTHGKAGRIAKILMASGTTSAPRLLKVNDGVSWLSPFLTAPDPRQQRAPLPRDSDTIAVIGTRPAGAEASLPEGTPGMPRKHLIRTIPATTRAGARMVPYVPLNPAGGMVERLYSNPRKHISFGGTKPDGSEAEGQAEVTGEGDSMLDVVRKLLELLGDPTLGPDLLAKNWTARRSDGKPMRELPPQLQSVISTGSLLRLWDLLQGPGLVLSPDRTVALGNWQLELGLRARGDLHKEGMPYLDTVGDLHKEGMPYLDTAAGMNCVRYSVMLDASSDHWEKQRGSGAGDVPGQTALSAGITLTGGESGAPGAGSTIPRNIIVGTTIPAYSRITGKAGYEQKVHAERDTVFISGRADRYGGDAQIEVTLNATWIPSRLFNTLGLNLPRMLVSWLQNTAGWRRAALSSSVDFKTRNAIPHQLIHDVDLPEPPPGDIAAVEEMHPDDPVPGRRLNLPPELFRSGRAVTAGAFPERLQIYHDEVLPILAGKERPLNRRRSRTVARLFEHGSRGRTALRYLLSYQVFTRLLEEMLPDDGRKLHAMIREGGPLTDNHGDVTLQVQLVDPHILGPVAAVDEKIGYGFHEEGWHWYRENSISMVSPDGGGTVNIGNLSSTARTNFSTDADFSFTSSEQWSEGAALQHMDRVNAMNRSVGWQRVSADVISTLTAKAQNKRSFIRWWKSLVKARHRLRQAVELYLSPEACIQLDLYPRGGFPDGSGSYYPGPPDSHPASTYDLLHAAFSKPFLRHAFGVQAQAEGDEILNGDGRMSLPEFTAALRGRLAQLPPEPPAGLSAEEQPPPGPKRLDAPDDPIVMIMPYGSAVRPGHVTSIAQVVADLMGRPVIATRDSYLITRDGSVLAIRLRAPGHSAFGDGWQEGTWEIVFPRAWGRQAPALPYNLADALARARLHLKSGVRAGNRPPLVGPPRREVHFGIDSPAAALDSWRHGITAAHRLAAVARELLPAEGQQRDELERALHDADVAVRAVPGPPTALPATPADQDAAWQDLARFKDAAAVLGRTVAAVLDAAFGRWQESVRSVSELPRQARELLPGGLPEATAKALARLDEAVRQVPRPPVALPVTVDGVVAIGQSLTQVRARTEAAGKAMDDVVSSAVGDSNARLAAAEQLAGAVRELLPRTGAEQRDALERALDDTQALARQAQAALPGTAPGPDPARYQEAARQALHRLADLESATRNVIAAATGLGDLQEIAAEHDSLVAAAREMLPYTGGHHNVEALRAALDYAVTMVKRTKPAWWRANAAEFTTAEEVAAAVRGLTTIELDRFFEEVGALKEALDDVASRANGWVDRLRAQSAALRSRVLPHAGSSRPRLERMLAAAEFTIPEWPDLRADTVADIAALARRRAYLKPAEDRLREVTDAIADAAWVTLRQRHRAILGPAGRILDLLQQAGRSWRIERLNFERRYEAVQTINFHGRPRRWLDELTKSDASPDTVAQEIESLQQAINAVWSRLVADPLKELETAAHDLAEETQRFLRHGGDGQAKLAEHLYAAQLGLGIAKADTAVASEDAQLRPGLLSRRTSVSLYRQISETSPRSPDLSRPATGTEQSSVTGPSWLTREHVPDVPRTAGEISAAKSKLDRLRNDPGDFFRAVEDVLAAGWQSRRDALISQVKQLAPLARYMGGARSELPDELLRRLQSLPDSPPVLAGSAPAQDMTVITRALAAMTEIETQLSRLSAETADELSKRVDRARTLAETAQARAADAALGEALDSTGRLLSQALDLPADLSATQREADAAPAAAQMVAELEDLIRRIKGQATAEPYREQAIRADRLAAAVPGLLRHTGGEQDRLTREFSDAIGRLRQVMPRWWVPGQGEPDELEQIEATTAALRDNALAGAITAIEQAVRDVLAAVKDWQSIAEGIQDTARPMLHWLDDGAGGEHGRHQLRDELEQLKQLLPAATATDFPGSGIAAPEEIGIAAPEEMERVVEAINPVLRLETGMRGVIQKLADAARQREAELTGLTGQALQLLVGERWLAGEAGTMYGSLRDARRAAGRAVRELAARPAPSTAQAWDQVQQATTELAGLETAIREVLAQVMSQLPQRARDNKHAAQRLQSQLPDPDGRGYGLTSLWEEITPPVGDEDPAELPAAMNAAVREVAKVTALEAAINRVLIQVSAELPGHVATAVSRAEAARALLPHVDGEQDQLRRALEESRQAVELAARALPDEGRLPTALADLVAMRSLREPVTGLEAATERVLTMAAPALDQLRHDVRQVLEARAAVGAARELLPHAGSQPADLSARLAAAAEQLHRLWPVSSPPNVANPVTAADIQAAARALDQRLEFPAGQQAAREAVTGLLVQVHQPLLAREEEIAARADLLRGMLDHVGDQPASLETEIGAAEADGTAPQQPRPATLAGVEAASRDIERIAAAGEKLSQITRRVIEVAQLESRLREAAPLAAAARDLLRGPQHMDVPEPEQALPSAAQPVPALPGQVETAEGLIAVKQALDYVNALQATSREVFTGATAKLETAWQQASAARHRAADARTLLPFTGPEQASLADRLDRADRAQGRLHMLRPTRWRPGRPGLITLADLESARQALAGDVAGQLQSVARDFDAAASAVTTVTRDTWEQARRTAEELARITQLAVDKAGNDAAPDLRNALRLLSEAIRDLGQAPAGPGEMTGAGERRKALLDATAELDGTSWRRAYLLLGGDPERHYPALGPQWADRAIAVADALVRQDGRSGSPDAEKFAWLARRIGLHHRDLLPAWSLPQVGDPAADMARLLRFLLLADEVFNDGTTDLDQVPGLLGKVTNLRRLADVAVAHRGHRFWRAEATLAELRAEAQLHAEKQDGVVEIGRIRDLVTMTGQAKEAKRQAATGLRSVLGAGRVTRQDLAALARTAALVRQAQEYLDDSLDLTIDQREELIWKLLNGIVTDEARSAVINLLRTIPGTDLPRVLGWRLARRLASVISSRSRLRGELVSFVVERYGAGAPLESLSRASVPLNRPFSPAMISKALADRGPDDDLNREQLEQARETAQGRSDEANVRKLGLSRQPGPGGSASEHDKGLSYVRRLREATERADRIREFQRDTVKLDHTALAELIRASLRGLARFQAVETMAYLDLHTLNEIRDDLAAELDDKIPEGHLLYPEIEDVVKALIDPATREPYSHIPPPVAFSLDLISPRLSGIDPRRREELDRAEWITIGAALAERTDRRIRADLDLRDPRAQNNRDDWLRDVGATARLVHRAQQYLTAASWKARMTFTRRRDMVSDLLRGPAAWQALELLSDMDSAELARMFPAGAQGSLWDQLVSKIPAAGVRHLLTARFDADRKVRPDVQPPSRFTLDRISDSLRGLEPGEELTVEQVLLAADATTGHMDKILRGMPPAELRWATLELSDLGEALIDLAARRLSGAPAFQLSIAALGQLIGHLLVGPITGTMTDRVRRVLIATLRATDAEELAVIYSPGLRAALERAIPSGPLRVHLEEFFASRIDADGSVRMDIQPARPFHWKLIDRHLSVMIITDRKLPEQKPYSLRQPRNGAMPAAVAPERAERIIGELGALPPLQRAVAAWNIANVLDISLDKQPNWVDLPMSSDVSTLDRVLGWLYRDQARQIPDAQWLRDLTWLPPISRISKLTGISRADVRKEEEFRVEVSGDKFRHRVLRALRQDTDALFDTFARQADSQNRYDLHNHVGPMARLADGWIRESLGSLVPESGQIATADPGDDGLLYDYAAYREWERRNWDADQKREEAKELLEGLLANMSSDYTATRAVLAELNIHPETVHGEPNDDARIVSEFIDDLLEDQENVNKTLAISDHRYAGFATGDPGTAGDAGAKILVPLFRRQGAREDRRNRYKLAQEVLRGLWAAKEHKDFTAFAEGDDSAGIMLRQGITTMLTGWVWDHVLRSIDSGQDYHQRVRQVVEREYVGQLSPLESASVPESHWWMMEYPQLAPLLSGVGFLNLLGAFLLGDVSKINGPARGSRRSLLNEGSFPRLDILIVTSQATSPDLSAATSPDLSPVPSRPPSPHLPPPSQSPPPPQLTPPGATGTAELTEFAGDPLDLPAAELTEFAGDPLDLPVHVGAIVSAADTRLVPRDAPGYRIRERGGASLTEEIQRRYPGGASTGTAVDTGAPGLNTDHLIHVVTPDFEVTGQAEYAAYQSQMRAAYRNALAAAGRLGVASVAFSLEPAHDGQDAAVQAALQFLAQTRDTPTTVRSVYLITPLPAGQRSLADLEADRLERIRQRDERRRQVQLAYQRIRRELRLVPPVTPANPGEIGECLPVSLRTVFPERLRGFFSGDVPTPAQLRQDLVARLDADWAASDRGAEPRFGHLFPGTTTGSRQRMERRRAEVRRNIGGTPVAWNTDDYDLVAELAARVYGLPVTLLGPDRPYDIGPESPREGYLLYDSDHYVAVEAPGAVPSADELYRWEPGLWAPSDQEELERGISTYLTGFGMLRDRFQELLDRSPEEAASTEKSRGDDVIADFNALLLEDAPWGKLDRIGALYSTFQREIVGELEYRQLTRLGGSRDRG